MKLFFILLIGFIIGAISVNAQFVEKTTYSNFLTKLMSNLPLSGGFTANTTVSSSKMNDHLRLLYASSGRVVSIISKPTAQSCGASCSVIFEVMNLSETGETVTNSTFNSDTGWYTFPSSGIFEIYAVANIVDTMGEFSIDLERTSPTAQTVYDIVWIDCGVKPGGCSNSMPYLDFASYGSNIEFLKGGKIIIDEPSNFKLKLTLFDFNGGTFGGLDTKIVIKKLL